jgi:Domain of unknown function (DUF4279)
MTTLGNEVTVSLTLTSTEGSPEDVTARTGLQPTESWRTGDRIGKTVRLYTMNGWSLSSGLDSSAELDDHLRALLDLVEPVRPALSELSTRWELEVSCALYAREYVPACHFDRETIRRLASIGAEIDVDFYCLLEEESIRTT